MRLQKYFRNNQISQNNQKIVIIEVDERRGVSALSEKASMDS